ncbi:Adenosylcobinamide amidohydrolase [Sporobacter termitidis DSM 10068]|uniref:Adenosylcobinamide amidohydrolase n=1 Tax=Sporobacter termitidis DSM 10068 TaxID=1123282 RepID=A0A1M5UEY8_9FIRM|nr:adenosylcobinamide amidohydrolase [Sporobacter termitidis]SHH61527.1 Adenosylcobinamide amidohydrolase [Sporobacter termitidis DSM 10068]
MILHRFGNGDVVESCGKALIARFAGPRRVLSTSALNGGIKDSLTSVFNQDCKEDGEKNVPLKALTYEEHLKIVSADLGLESQTSTGLTTAADMENVSIAAETYDNVTVTAVVTGGIDVNGGRVGDPADWHESAGVCAPAPGTINILLFISAALPEGTLARALVTCTEAKTAALQELLAPSMYSSGIATGSGTDGTIIVSDLTSPVVLTYAGKHSKLGELIGRAVMKAVKKALYLQTGLGPAQQFDIFSRLGRYGVTRAGILKSCTDGAKLDALSKQSDLVVPTSLYVHLLDQLSWGLIGPADAVASASRLLEDMGMKAEITQYSDAKSASEAMLSVYVQGLQKMLL